MQIICEGAFCGPNLKSVFFSDESIKRIEKRAFAHSTGLKEIKIPKYINYIGEEAFIDCQSLEIIEFNQLSQLKEISKFCFAFSGLKKIILPFFVTIINDSSFFLCQNLKNVNINETNIAYIGKFAFSHTSIETLQLPNSIKCICSGAFYGIKSLNLVDFSEMGQINIEKITNDNMLYTKYKKILDDTKNYLDRFGHILNRFKFVELNHSDNNQSNKDIKEKQNYHTSPKDKKPTYIIQSKKTTEKSSKKSKISAEIIKPVVDHNLAKSKRKIITSNNTHQISQPTTKNIIKSPRKLHKSKSNEHSNISEKDFDKFVNHKINKIYDNNFDDIFNEKFDTKYEEIILQKKCKKEVISNSNDSKKTVKEKTIKKSKKKSTSIFVNDDSDSKNISISKQSKETMEKKVTNINESDDMIINENNIDHIEETKKEEEEENDTNSEMNIKNVKKYIKKVKEKKSIRVNVEKKIIKEPSDENDIDEEEISNDNVEVEEDDKENKIEEEFGFEDDTDEDSINEIISNCYIDKTAFEDSTIQIFKFNLSEYKWFPFFDYCKNIKEYIVNPNFHLYLQKQKKEKSSNKIILGPYYECINIDFIPHRILFKYSIKKEIVYIENFFSKTEFKYMIIREKLLNPFYFVNLSHLILITLDDNIEVKEIPQNCFLFSTLKEITLPISLQKIDKGAFKDCYKLEKVNISKKCHLKILHSFSFYGCKKLKSICIPKKVCKIYQKAFSHSGLESIELPSSLCKISNESFYNCQNLNKIILNEGILEIGKSSFANNISLKSINFPNSLKTIKSNAFSNCYNLSNVNTSKNTQLVEIYNGAFENTQIEELKINRAARILFDPSNVPKLNKITFYQGEPINFVQLKDGTIYRKIEYIDLFEKLIFSKFYTFSSKIESCIKETIINQFIHPDENFRFYGYFDSIETNFKNEKKGKIVYSQIYPNCFELKLKYAFDFENTKSDHAFKYSNKYDLFRYLMEHDIKEIIFNNYLACWTNMIYLSILKNNINDSPSHFDFRSNYTKNVSILAFLAKNHTTVSDHKKQTMLELVFAP